MKEVAKLNQVNLLEGLRLDDVRIDDDNELSITDVTDFGETFRPRTEIRGSFTLIPLTDEAEERLHEDLKKVVPKYGLGIEFSTMSSNIKLSGGFVVNIPFHLVVEYFHKKRKENGESDFSNDCQSDRQNDQGVQKQQKGRYLH